MKKFSKESMQHFMLMHAEKLILGACLAATGVFVWMSMGAEESAVAAKDPSDLLAQAESSDRFMNTDAWGGEDGLERFRKGRGDAKGQIINTQPVDGSKFKLDFGGSPAEALAPRKDPAIIPPEQLIARRITNGVMMDVAIESPLVDFNAAPVAEEGEGQGFSGFPGGDDDYGDGLGSQGSGSGNRDGLPEEYMPLKRNSVFGDVNANTIRGIRPQALGISEKTITDVLDVVCVTAVVDFRKQAAEFENAFAESIAYNAKRDRPVYQFLQIQRKEVSDKGKQAAWMDISENVSYTFASSNPLSAMPFQMHGGAPEVIAPENWDPILTGPIPAFAQYDYQSIASHPALKTLREFPAWKPPAEMKKIGEGGEDGPDINIFNQGGDEDRMDQLGGGSGMDDGDGINGLRSGTETELYKEAIVNREPGGQYRLVRFFDLLAPKNRSYEYRVRVWVGDPNQIDPSDGFKKNRGSTLSVADRGDRNGGGSDLVKFSSNGDGMKGSMDEMDQEKDGAMSMDARKEVVLAVQKTMLTPAARMRTAAGTDFDVMQEQLREDARRLAESGGAGSRRQTAMLPSFYVSEYAAGGQLEQIELPPSPSRYAYMQYLRYARPSAWSESVRVEQEAATGDVLAGTTVRIKKSVVKVAGRDAEFESGEPAVKVLVSSWVRNVGSKLPAERNAYVGETMNFNDQAYVTHPITWKILVPEWPGIEGIRKYTMPFRTNKTIVDAFFGDTRVLSTDSRLSMELATEILTMDANGNLSVSNQFESATDYRNELAMPDDSRYYGRERLPKPKKDEYAEDYGDEYE